MEPFIIDGIIITVKGMLLLPLLLLGSQTCNALADPGLRIVCYGEIDVK